MMLAVLERVERLSEAEITYDVKSGKVEPCCDVDGGIDWELVVKTGD
jgi:hypothetical protein